MVLGNISESGSGKGFENHLGKVLGKGSGNDSGHVSVQGSRNVLGNGFGPRNGLGMVWRMVAGNGFGEWFGEWGMV